MVKLISVSNIQQLISQVGLQAFFKELIKELESVYSRWSQFQKSARHAVHVKDGVIELMPICDDDYYAFKYVNGHPKNPEHHKQTVVAVGLLSDVKTGYPLMLSEMTLLTAFRTAATSVLAAKYLAKPSVKVIGIIGCGAQSEFQVLAQHAQFTVKQVKYFDIDSQAMKKFHDNLKDQSFELTACENAAAVLENVDIITTATAGKHRAKILSREWIQNGLHINAIGGDTPGKTELGIDLLKDAKIVVEFLPQSEIEGEIQQLREENPVYAELWEIIVGQKKGRVSPDEITLFDSVGFAIEDFAVLRCIHRLSVRYSIGSEVDLVPELPDPKDLFGVLKHNPLNKH